MPSAPTRLFRAGLPYQLLLSAEGLPLEVIERIIAIAFGLFLLMFFVPQLFGSESWKEVFEARKCDAGMPKEFKRRRRWRRQAPVFLVIIAVIFLLAGA